MKSKPRQRDSKIEYIDLSSKIRGVRAEVYDAIHKRRKCYGFRDWEIVKPSHPLDYSEITERLFGVKSQYMASVDVVGCVSRCFYCWVDWENEREFDAKFYSTREIVNELSKLKGDIWRFTGGEPLIVPELVLEVATEINLRGLDKVFWLETNLLPLIVYKNFPEQLSSYEKVAVHCSIKAADPESFEQVTGLRGEYYQQSLEALEALIDNGVQVFPSFVANAVRPDKISLLFHDLREIHPDLPLRFMVRPILFYNPTSKRTRVLEARVYSFKTCLRIWDALISETYGIKYSSIKRWKIKL